MISITVEELLKKGIFQIPNYQRGYAWEKQQVEDFLEDLREVNIKKTNKLKEHYTGTITVIQLEAIKYESKTFDLYEVVDGQQRLTTFTIFMQVVYNRLKVLKAEDDDLKDVLNTIMYRKTHLLALNGDNNEFYKKYIINGEAKALVFATKAQKNLMDAKIQIEKFLLQHYNKREKLQDLQECLLRQFKVNFFIISNELEVGVVFEAMNNRGVQLSNIDKIKNYLIYIASLRDESGKLGNNINTVFANIFKELMKTGVNITHIDEDSILRYCYIIYYGGKNVKEKENIYLLVKGKITKDEKETKNSEIIGYAKFLEKVVTYYSQIMRSDFDNIDVKILIKKIVFLGNPMNFLPLIISLLDTYEEEDLIPVLQMLEKFSFRVYKVGNHKATTAQTIFHSYASKIYEQSAHPDDLIEKLADHQYMQSKSFKQALQHTIFYSVQQNNKVAYLFYEYECYLHELKKSSLKLLDFDTFSDDIRRKSLSIEHIMPQTEDTVKELHKLGNLTITYDNSALSNSEFNVKKQKYKSSKLLVENALIEYKSWDVASINNRTKELLEFALEKWGI